MATKTKSVEDMSQDEMVIFVVKLRNDDSLRWNEIAAQVNKTEGQAQYLYFLGTEEKAPATAKSIVKLRSGGASWGKISAKTGISESAARKLFTEESGTEALGHRIGKGGKHPGQTNGDGSSTSAKPKGAKQSTKKAAAAPSGGGKKKIDKLQAASADGSLTVEMAKELLEGFGVQVTGKSGTDERIAIRSVNGLSKDVLKVTEDEKGANRIVKVGAVKAITGGKVVKSA